MYVHSLPFSPPPHPLPQWFNDKGHPRINSYSEIGCPNPGSCNFVHPTDRDWDLAKPTIPPPWLKKRGTPDPDASPSRRDSMPTDPRDIRDRRDDTRRRDSDRRSRSPGSASSAFWLLQCNTVFSCFRRQLEGWSTRVQPRAKTTLRVFIPYQPYIRYAYCTVCIALFRPHIPQQDNRIPSGSSNAMAAPQSSNSSPRQPAQKPPPIPPVPPPLSIDDRRAAWRERIKYILFLS